MPVREKFDSFKKDNPLFRDVKEYNKYLLMLISVSILVLTGVISYFVSGSYARWNMVVESNNVLKLNVTRKKMIDVIKSRVGKDGLTKIDQSATGQITYSSTDYRYSGSNDSVNNYIDFNGETWRIIGVFTVDDGNGGTEERVKIVREKPLSVLKGYGYSYGRWYYNSSSYLTDSYSYYYLNNTYYNSIDKKYKALVADTNYYLGITSSYSTITASTAYTAERASKSTSYDPQYQSAKVGLMYASDYGYAADSSCYSTALYSYSSSCYSKDWLYNGTYTSGSSYTYTGSSTASYELFMTGYSGSYANTLNVTTGSNYRSSYSTNYLVRPTIYLKADTRIENGNGTKDSHYKVHLPSNLDKSGANEPELTSNMIPVYYDSTNAVWKKADSANLDQNNKWYDYNDKMWANAVTVTETNRSTYLSADAGIEISMDDINTMWVWIPRYTYTYLNTNTPEEIKIKFEKETENTGTIKCTDNVSGSGTTSQTCTDTTNGSLVAGTSTYTHPAFTFGDTELTGLWVGKFESSATTIPTSESITESTVIIKPNVQSLRYKKLSYFFRDARQMEKASNVYGFPQSSSTTFNWNGELTGDTNNIDTYMMKNIEWGAVTYLYHSKYGRCTNGSCEELTINNCSTYTTGIGADEVSASKSDTTCTTDKNKYNGESGVKASTTGNVYGVYDMSGGSYEYTMGNMVNSSNQFYTVNASNNWNTTTYPLSKYYDSYTYDGSSFTTYTRGRLGDATLEMAPTGIVGNWYSDYAHVPYSTSSWFRRGGSCATGANAGSFSSDIGGGGASIVSSFRVSLVAQAS